MDINPEKKPKKAIKFADSHKNEQQPAQYGRKGGVEVGVNSSSSSSRCKSNSNKQAKQ